MATLNEYFNTDFRNVLKIGRDLIIGASDSANMINVQVLIDFDAGVKYLAYYLPACHSPFEICIALLTNPTRTVAESIDDEIQVSSGGWGTDWIDSTELKFSGRIFIYIENDLSEQERFVLSAIAKQEGLSLLLRDAMYSQNRSIVLNDTPFSCCHARAISPSVACRWR